MTGAFSMLMRLMSRMRKKRREAQTPALLSDRGVTSNFMADGIPVSFRDGHPSPAVRGVLSPRTSFPLASIVAVLIHELAHASWRDNLIRLFCELSLCALWFHPLIWLAEARINLYRELSRESVIRRAHGQELVSALAKLAVPEGAGLLQASASWQFELSVGTPDRPAQATRRAASLLLSSLFAIIIAVGIFQTIALLFHPKALTAA
jgi:beta-lactamase regulating signal transducer with metallopeptidase domain